MGKKKKGHHSRSSSSSSSSSDDDKRYKKHIKKHGYPPPGVKPPKGAHGQGGNYPAGPGGGVGMYPGGPPGGMGGGYPGGPPGGMGGGYPGGPPPGGYPGGPPGGMGGGYPGGPPGGGYPAGPPGGGYPGGPPGGMGGGYPGGPPGGMGGGYPGGMGGGYPGGPPPGGMGGGYPGGGPMGGPPQQASYGAPPMGAPGGYPAQSGGYPGQQPPGGPGMSNLASAMGAMNLGSGGEVYRGTIRPPANFNAEQDCNVLRKAMKGLGTDEKAIIEVVGRRTSSQRQEIKRMFKTMFGKDLISELKSELGANFEKLVVALFEDPTRLDVLSLRHAMEGAGTKEQVLTEILTTRTNQEIARIREDYKKHLNRDLEKDIISETSGYYKRVLVSCCQGNRQELTPDQVQRLQREGVQAIIDHQLAQREAQELHQAGEKQMGTDEGVFIRIFAIRNIYQLRATFEEYKKLAGKDILASIDSEMSGDLRHAVKSVALSVMNRPLFFARCLNSSMAGLGTDDSTLIRIIVTRSEIDMENIKEEFQRKYGKPVSSFISGDTSGDYKKLLLILIGQ